MLLLLPLLPLQLLVQLLLLLPLLLRFALAGRFRAESGSGLFVTVFVVISCEGIGVFDVGCVDEFLVLSGCVVVGGGFAELAAIFDFDA